MHLHRSTFLHFHYLEDRLKTSRKPLTSAQEDLQAWPNAEIYGVKLALAPGAEWVTPAERLLADASHLISNLDSVTDQRRIIHSMVSAFISFGPL